MDEPTEIDLVKLAEMHDALHAMIGWYYEVPLDVRKRWVGMPGVVQGFIDTFGPWIYAAESRATELEEALREAFVFSRGAGQVESPNQLAILAWRDRARALLSLPVPPKER